MDQTIRALLAVDTGLDSRELSELVPTSGGVRLAGVIEGLDESWKTLQETPVDILLVACLGYSDRALFLIDGARKQNPQLSVLVLSQGSAIRCGRSCPMHSRSCSSTSARKLRATATA